MVDGRTPGGNVVSYFHEGNSTAASDATSYAIQPLIPDTTYQIKLSTLTNRGEGKQITVQGKSAAVSSDFGKIL